MRSKEAGKVQRIWMNGSPDCLVTIAAHAPYFRGVLEMNKKMRLQNVIASIYRPASIATFAAFFWSASAPGQTTQDIRIVTYNTQGDVGINNASLLPNLATVLEGVGQEKYVGDNILQLPDIIALQETTSNAITVTPLATDLNNFYGSSIFGSSTFQATQSGGNTDGNGPNALIYNQKTLSLIASVGVGTPGGASNGEFRQVVRYEFQPIAGTAAQDFYVYVTHSKSLSSGTQATDQLEQQEEATIIRNNEATLPANASVLYVGDFNVDTSTDPSMVEMSSAGPGQAFDPLNPTNQSQDWSENSAFKGIMTETDGDLRYRDDLQLVTSNVLNDAPGSLDYIANSLHAFGNNGSTAVFGNVNSTSNTALNDIVGNGSLTPSQVLAAMNKITGSDHLAVVADYSIDIGPLTLTWNNATGSGDGQTWDFSSQNWNNGSAVASYTDGSNVVFNDSNNAHYAVTLNAMVQPGSVLINNNSGNYTISGSGGIAGTTSLTKSGIGTATLSTVNTYTGGTNVTAGTLIIAANGSLPANQAVSLTGGSIQLAPNTGGETISSLAIANGATLDLTNNHIIINYGNSSAQATVDSAVAGFIASGAIFSSLANDSFGVGWADGKDASESGIVPANSVLVTYALYGDANLDGLVNGDDFSVLASNLNKTVSGWDQGDFLHTGSVTGDDFSALVNNLGKQADGADVVLPASDLAAIDAFAAANGLMADVPEPGAAILILPAAVLLLSRQKRFTPPQV
jgi:autotransporter-associated beta strand protein